METQNSMLMKQARDTLAGKWGLAIGTMAVYMITISVLQSIPSVNWIISLLLGGPMSLGLATFVLAFSRNQNPQLEQIFSGFKKFSLSLGAYLLVIIYVLLWSLLFIVPGIVAALSYSMVFYILADKGADSAKDALEASKKMMYGRRWKFFCLLLRFLGWFVLSILTLGIGLLWLFPYIQISVGKFYDDIKNIPPVPVKAE